MVRTTIYKKTDNGKFRNTELNRLDIFVEGDMAVKLEKIFSQVRNERMWFDFQGNEVSRAIADDMEDNEKPVFFYNYKHQEVSLNEY